MRPVRISPLEERHIGGIVEVERLCQPAPWSETSFRKEIQHPGGIFLVAEEGGRIVGYCACWVIVDEAHIITVAVHPDCRRDGLGTKLVVETLLHAQERGAKCATLEARVSNEAAIALYSKLGFVHCGVRPLYYPNDRESAAVMWLHDLARWSAPARPRSPEPEQA